MVDWNKLGKDAFDLSKKVGKKGMDSLQEKRVDKRQQKEIAKLREKSKLKNPRKLSITILDSNEDKKLKLRNSFLDLQQDYPGEVIFLNTQEKGKRFNLLSLEFQEASQAKRTSSIGGAVVGGLLGGGVGALIGGTGGKNSEDTSTALITLEDFESGETRRILIMAPQNIRNSLMMFTTKEI